MKNSPPDHPPRVFQITVILKVSLNPHPSELPHPQPRMETSAQPPDFLIIGVQKGGTTSLYNYLIQHPQILPASQKEVHYFDLNYDKGPEWYLQQFPPRHLDQLAGEASPYYIFHPHVPQRVYQFSPQIKLILLLRNPIDRAISHYYYYIKIRYETLPLEEAIAAEPQRLQGELEKLLADETYYSYNHQHHSYLTRGHYADQLQTWLQYFPQEQLLILKSEDLYHNPAGTFNRVLTFLNLPPHPLKTYAKHNAGDYPPINPTTYQHLKDYFRPHNGRLTDLLGREFNWD